jgi:hypothetical protein
MKNAAAPSNRTNWCPIRLRSSPVRSPGSIVHDAKRSGRRSFKRDRRVSFPSPSDPRAVFGRSVRP